MKMFGVKKIIGLIVLGSLKFEIKSGDFVVCDQFVDRIWGRKDIFFEGFEVRYIFAVKLYCEYLRKIVIEFVKEFGIIVYEKGIVVVI